MARAKLAAILFALASFLNGLGEDVPCRSFTVLPQDNPLKGISFGSLTGSPEKLEQVATKGAKLLKRGEQEVAFRSCRP